MTLVKAIREGLGGKGKLASAIMLFCVPLALSFLAGSPLRSGLHAAFDRYPASKELLNGGGLDLLAETGLRQPAFWAAGFSLFLPMLLFSLLLGLWAQAGAYSLALPEAAENPWRRIWPAATKLLPKFLLVATLNAILWGVVAVLAAMPFAALNFRFKENTDPGPGWHLFLAEIVALAIFWNIASAAGGCAKAATVLRIGGGNVAKSYLAGLKFSLRKFAQVEAMTWGFFALRLAAFAATVLAFPIAVTYGGAVMKWLLFQMAIFAMAFLRVAEMRSQVAYLAGSQPEPAPVKEEKAPQPAEVEVLSSASL